MERDVVGFGLVALPRVTVACVHGSSNSGRSMTVADAFEVRDSGVGEFVRVVVER